MRGSCGTKKDSKIVEYGRVWICEHRLRRGDHAKVLESRQIGKQWDLGMLDPVSPPRRAVCLCRVLIGIQGDVDGLISNCVQHDLKTLTIIESNGLVQIIRSQKGIPVPPPTYGSNIAAVLASTVPSRNPLID